MMRRLVTFLGTGNYQPVVYRDSASGREAPESRWVGCALAEVYRPQEILILATPTAWQKHGADLLADLRTASFSAEFRSIDDGGAPENLWQQFETIKSALRAPQGTSVILDITHGFRSQPFFAAAVVAFVRAVDAHEVPLTVVYGGFEAKDANGIAPIWDLTPFVDLLDYTRAIMLFLKTGRVAGVAERAEALGRNLARTWSQAGRDGPRPALDDLARALGAFGRDLETVRTGALLLGDGRRPGSAAGLATAIAHARSGLAAQLPPLADVLDRIEAMVTPLTAARERLNTGEGHASAVALARLYLAMGRYTETATTVREGLVTLYASDRAACPGLPGFAMDLREEAEKTWQTRDRDVGRRVARVRNDIDHGGFRLKPLKGKQVAEQIADLVELFATAEAKPSPGCHTVFVNISNHPSAQWSQAQRQAALEFATRIVDIPFPDVAPDSDAPAIAELAENLLITIPEGTSHAMVQGEFTLAFAIVRGLQRRGVCCLAATAERDVIADANGDSTRRFRFVRFRPYPS